MTRILLSALLLAACGTEIGNPKKPKETPAPQPTSVISDSGVAAELIGAQADEIITAAGEDTQSATLVLQLDEAPPTTSACTANADGTVTVQENVDGAMSRTFTAYGQPGSYTAQIDGSDQSQWRLPDGALKCDGAKDDLTVDWTAADGLTRVANLSSTKTFTITRTGPHGPLSHAGTAQVKGTRNVVWHRDAASDSGTSFALGKTVTSTLDKSVKTSRHGQPITVASHIEVSAAAPVQIEMQRDKTTQAVTSAVIISGTVSSTQDEGSRLDSTYDNLTFSPDGGCAPDSGTITGATYAPGATAPTHKYTVTFSAGTATITFDDGTQAPYVPTFCNLD